MDRSRWDIFLAKELIILENFINEYINKIGITSAYII